MIYKINILDDLIVMVNYIFMLIIGKNCFKFWDVLVNFYIINFKGICFIFFRDIWNNIYF